MHSVYGALKTAPPHTLVVVAACDVIVTSNILRVKISLLAMANRNAAIVPKYCFTDDSVMLRQNLVWGITCSGWRRTMRPCTCPSPSPRPALVATPSAAWPPPWPTTLYGPPPVRRERERERENMSHSYEQVRLTSYHVPLNRLEG